MDIKKVILTATTSISAIALTSIISVGAAAAPLIYGTIGYTSAPQPKPFGEDDGNELLFTSYTGWSYDSGSNSVTVGDAIVDIATGDLSGLLGNSVEAVSFIYDPFVSPQTLWTLDDGFGNEFVFQLNNVNSYFEFGSFLLLKGEGTISSADFETTDFSWEFTGQSLTFSTGSIAAPEPGTLALLGAGLLGLAASRKATNAALAKS